MPPPSVPGRCTLHPAQPSLGGGCYIIPVHLLCSREDPFPSVVLEAMSAGVPTVAFEDSGGAPDVLRDHGAGVAVPLGDATAMVRQLRALALGTRPEDQERMRTAARRHFAWDPYADELLAMARPALRSVSVVVPNYNYGRYLEGRLRSVFAQTHPVAEVLVLDDASTDDSADVVRRVAHDAGRVVGWDANARNSGSVFRQWRRAVDRARGEWVWLAEADDSAEPGFLQALCSALDNAPDAVMAFTDSRAMDADGKTVWPSYQEYYAQAGAALLAQDGVHPAADVLQHCLADRNLILNASAVLWRRTALQAALRRCGPELDGYRMAGDWRIYAEVLSQGGTVAYVAQPLNVHRRHGASVTGALPAAQHLDEVTRMQRHMRGVLGGGTALAKRQRRALMETKAALRAR